MGTDEIQGAFFKHIKKSLPSHLSLADEIAGLLNISQDSAYRRIRCEKFLTLDEIQILATHYRISLDAFMKIEPASIGFNGTMIDKGNFSFQDYLQQMIKQLSSIERAQHKELFYLNKDIPIFHLFMFPELACFKCYFWMRYNLNYTEFNKGQFLIEDFIDIFNDLGTRISQLYLDIPSTEIWNVDCINTTIRQIDFYRETKIFQSKDDIIIIYECLEKLVDHIEQQVELGYKFPYKKPSLNNQIKYTVFINEFVLGDNTVAVEADERKFVFLNHSVINYVVTENKRFVDYVFDTIHTLLKKSTLISEIGEKERQLFFRNLRKKIVEKKQLV